MSSSVAQYSASVPKPTNLNTQTKIIEKLINDLEELCKKLIDLYQSQQSEFQECFIKDDCYELQKFCAKLESLIQFNLKEKKGILSGQSSSNSNNYSNSSAYNETNVNSNREYWNFILDVLKSSRSFEDAIKYVKNINEIKTNLGRGRAFIRFCLQYHRLADAIQQLTMEDKILNNWYKEKSVWLNQEYKSRIIQLLYDLSDINFELISKNNFELDTTWPTIHLSSNRIQALSRNRTTSISSYNSINIERDKDQTDTQSILLSSTPIEMDDDLIYSNITCNQIASSQPSNQAQKPTSTFLSANDNMSQSIYYDTTNTNLINHIEQYEKRIEDLVTQLSLKDTQLSNVLEDLKLKNQNDKSSLNNSSNENTNENNTADLISQIKSLNEQLNQKNHQNNELNSCLIKQSNLCENLSELLKKSEEKNKELNLVIEKQLSTIANLQNDLDSIKFELSTKIIQEEQLKKDVLSQTESINSLKQISLQQEKTIKELKCELNVAIQERSTEVETQLNEAQRNKIALQLKEEEIYLLNDQMQKLCKSLDTEKSQNVYLTNELNEIKSFYKNLNEKNTILIQQLEADNNEIKKRLVKLIKEKAELWQKADNLEYENLLKTNSMWIDDANVSNCMSCNSAFGLLLRKHHCRICLKIFCYYCCNNWIEYNNSKLRVCKKCYDTRENVNKIKNIFNDGKNIQQAENEIEEDDDEDDDDPDINFEVRPEKLNSADQSTDDIYANIYDHAYKKSSNSSKENLATITNTEEVKPGSNLSSNVEDNPKASKLYDINNLETNLNDNENDSGEADESDLNNPQNTPTTSKLLNKLVHKFEFKYLNFNTNSSKTTETETADSSDLIIRRKKIKKKVKKQQLNQELCSNSEEKEKTQDDLDTFAIVSQDEIDRIKN